MTYECVRLGIIFCCNKNVYLLTYGWIFCEKLNHNYNILTNCHHHGKVCKYAFKLDTSPVEFIYREEGKIEKNIKDQVRCYLLHMYTLEWAIGDPTHVKTRPEPEGFMVGSGRVGLFKVRVFSGRVPDGVYDFGFFRGSPIQFKKTRSF